LKLTVGVEPLARAQILKQALVALCGGKVRHHCYRDKHRCDKQQQTHDEVGALVVEYIFEAKSLREAFARSLDSVLALFLCHICGVKNVCFWFVTLSFPILMGTISFVLDAKIQLFSNKTIFCMEKLKKQGLLLPF